MKLILTTFLSLLVLTSQTVAQGYIFFANVSHDFAVEKRIMDYQRLKYLTSQYVAQLFSGPEGASESSLCPVDAPVAFLDGPDDSGFFLGPALMIPGVSVGSIATFQVRVWSSAYATWELGYQASLADYNRRIGWSQPFRMKTGSEEQPTELALAMPGFGVGVIPEPAIASLLGLGGFYFYVLAKKKPAKPGSHCANEWTNSKYWRQGRR
jgi:hypothetical protein